MALHPEFPRSRLDQLKRLPSRMTIADAGLRAPGPVAGECAEGDCSRVEWHWHGWIGAEMTDQIGYSM
jgi:hypothetical protein